MRLSHQISNAKNGLGFKSTAWALTLGKVSFPVPLVNPKNAKEIRLSVWLAD